MATEAQFADVITPELYDHLVEVGQKSRDWMHDQTPIARVIDFVDDQIQEASDGEAPSIWTQIAMMTYGTMDIEDPENQRESWMVLGELRQSGRQAFMLDPQLQDQVGPDLYRELWAGLVDYLLVNLQPKTLS